MDDLSSKIAAGADKLTELVKNIPGFSGYFERENRRESDAIQREYLAKRLTQLKADMQTAQQDALSNGNLAIMEPFDRISNKLDRVIELIRHANRGYAGFFDAIKVNEEELGRVYEYDMSLVTNVSAAEEALMAINGALSGTGDVNSAVRALQARVNEIDNAVMQRDNVMRGIGDN